MAAGRLATDVEQIRVKQPASIVDNILCGIVAVVGSGGERMLGRETVADRDDCQ